MKLRILSSLILSSSLLVGCGEEANEAPVAAEKPAAMEKAEVKVEKNDNHGHEHHDKKVAEIKQEVKAVAQEVKAVAQEVKAVVAPALAKASSDDTGTVHTVEMKNAGADGIMVYVPGFIKINKGDTVNFVASDAGHNAVSEVSSGASWQVGFSGGKVKFDDEGVNIYYCTPHRSMGMYGVIQVGEAKNKADAVAKANTIDGGFAMNSGRLNKYIEQVN